MRFAPPETFTRWLLRRTEAPDLPTAFRFCGEYLALRLWTLIVGCFSIETNLATARWLGRIWYRLIKRHRERALEHLRLAFGNHYGTEPLERIARCSFEHFAQLYLVELALTPRIVHEWSWARYVRLDDLGPVVRQLLSGRGTILLTAHFGNYELLGYCVARVGIPMVAVMRPLDNALVNRYLIASRTKGGLTLLDKRGATTSAGEILESGGALCFIADQNAGRKGVFVDFFGRKASTYKSIGLLAMHHRVPIVVASAVRVRQGFHYRIASHRIIEPQEWQDRDRPLEWITQEYTRALENAIRAAPEQYLWIHRRWKTRPKEEQRAAVRD